MVREPILLRSVLHDREIEVALTMARIEPLSTQPGPEGDILRSLETTPEWFRAFAAHSFLTCRPLRPRGVQTSYRPSSRCRHGLRQGNTGSTLPIPPQSVSRGRSFRGCTGSQLLRPVRLLASPDGSDRNTLPATGGFYVQAFDGAVTLTVAGYDYDIDWTPMSAGLTPAGMAATVFAALLISP